MAYKNMLSHSVYQVVQLVLHTETEAPLVLFCEKATPDRWLVTAVPTFMSLVGNPQEHRVREATPFNVVNPTRSAWHKRYQHYKGKFYRVLGHASEIGSPNAMMVIYYQEDAPDLWFARPGAMFYGTASVSPGGDAPIEVRRFALVSAD